MAKKNETTTALIKVEDRYLVLRKSAEVGELIKLNMGGKFEFVDLTRIKIPSGGGKALEIPGIGGTDFAEEINCIILYRRMNEDKAYWLSSEPSNNPPDCSSNDGIRGHGNPGGLCSECSLNKFKSAVNAKGEPLPGKACKDILLIFPLLPDDQMPCALALPPTSLRPFSAYCSMLTRAGHPYFGVITTIGLKECKSQGGVTYSQATFKVAREDGEIQILDAAQTAELKMMIYGEDGNSGLSVQLEAVRATESDYGNADSNDTN